MFDEIDEGTAIFKCTNNIPVNNGEAKFVDYEGVAPDHYLWLTGKAAELLKILYFLQKCHQENKKHLLAGWLILSTKKRF